MSKPKPDPSATASFSPLEMDLSTLYEMLHPDVDAATPSSPAPAMCFVDEAHAHEHRRNRQAHTSSAPSPSQAGFATHAHPHTLREQSRSPHSDHYSRSPQREHYMRSPSEQHSRSPNELYIPRSPSDPYMYSPREHQLSSPREYLVHSPPEHRVHSPRDPHAAREHALSPGEYLGQSPREYLGQSPREYLGQSPREYLGHSPREHHVQSPRERHAAHQSRERHLSHSPQEYHLSHSPQEYHSRGQHEEREPSQDYHKDSQYAVSRSPLEEAVERTLTVLDPPSIPTSPVSSPVREPSEYPHYPRSGTQPLPRAFPPRYRHSSSEPSAADHFVPFAPAPGFQASAPSSAPSSYCTMCSSSTCTGVCSNASSSSSSSSSAVASSCSSCASSGASGSETCSTCSSALNECAFHTSDSYSAGTRTGQRVASLPVAMPHTRSEPYLNPARRSRRHAHDPAQQHASAHHPTLSVSPFTSPTLHAHTHEQSLTHLSPSSHAFSAPTHEFGSPERPHFRAHSAPGSKVHTDGRRVVTTRPGTSPEQLLLAGDVAVDVLHARLTAESAAAATSPAVAVPVGHDKGVPSSTSSSSSSSFSSELIPQVVSATRHTSDRVGSPPSSHLGCPPSCDPAAQHSRCSSPPYATSEAISIGDPIPPSALVADLQSPPRRESNVDVGYLGRALDGLQWAVTGVGGLVSGYLSGEAAAAEREQRWTSYVEHSPHSVAAGDRGSGGASAVEFEVIATNWYYRRQERMLRFSQRHFERCLRDGTARARHFYADVGRITLAANGVDFVLHFRDPSASSAEHYSSTHAREMIAIVCNLSPLPIVVEDQSAAASSSSGSGSPAYTAPSAST